MGEGVPERHCVTVGDKDAQAVTEVLLEGLREGLGLPERVALTETLPLSVRLGEAVALREGEPDAEAHAVAHAEGVGQ